MNFDSDFMKKAEDEIALRGYIVNSDYNKPVFHISPEVGFINDPNGLIYYRGEYHIFYQWNPFFPGTKHVYWAHVKSKDLVHWERLRPSLAPDMWYDKNGCYSGSAIEYENKMYLIYTGNVKDNHGNRETYQCIAVLQDGDKFVKVKENPVIENQPKGYTAHFRDPKIFKKDDIFYFVLGAQNEELKGRSILYKSSDILNWEKCGELSFSSIDKENFGYMWECPNLFNLSGKQVFIFCPQGLQARGMLYNNIYQCGYIIGEQSKSDNLSFINCTEFTELDRGFEFYAPQIVYDGKRTIMIGWMGNPEEENQPSLEYGWMHCLTIPRELEIKNGKIYQKPVHELQKLRKNKEEVKNIKLENDEIELKKFNSDVYEMDINFDISKSKKLTVYLRSNKNKFVKLTFENSIFTVDRRHTNYDHGNTRSAFISDKNNLKLHIFSDKSSLEIFVNGGEEVFTLRTYLDEMCTATKIKAIGKAEILQGDFYNLD